MQKKGQLIIISGPSGVGKGTVNKILLEKNPNMCTSVSATTRAPRPGEEDGVHYFFKTKEAFEAMIRENAFLEYMQVFGMNYYGTPKAYVEEQREKGIDVILEIDVQGGMRVKEACPEAVLIFIAPPSMAKLKARLTGRGTETAEVIERRFAEAKQELSYVDRYDYVVVNDVLEDAVKAVEDIAAAEKLRVSSSKAFIQSLLHQ